MSRYTNYEVAEPPGRHGHIVRMALFFGGATLGCAAFVLLALINIGLGNYGYTVMLVVFGLIGLLFGIQARLYLRDLKARPVFIEGEIISKWHKGNLLIVLFPSYYIKVAGPDDGDFSAPTRIFSIRSIEYAGLLEEDLVRVQCYPHSLTVQQLERFDEISNEFVPAGGAIG